jgi:hypothetical protein
MINVTVYIGTGDRPMPDINDDLIINETMANQRAKQELAKSTYIVKSETLDMPHNPNGVVGVVSGEFSYTTLGILGRHFITSLTISLTPESAKDVLVAERYGRLVL